MYMQATRTPVLVCPHLSPSRPLSGLNPNSAKSKYSNSRKRDTKSKIEKEHLIISIIGLSWISFQGRKIEKEQEKYTKSNRRVERIIHHQWLFKVGKEGGVFRHNRSWQEKKRKRPWSIDNQNLIGFTTPKVTRLFIGIDMPDHVVWQTVHLIPSFLRHAGKTFGFSLVFESIGREVDAWSG